MKQQVLTFYTKLLGRIHQPLLPHINVHRPVQVSTSHLHPVTTTTTTTTTVLRFRFTFLPPASGGGV